MQTASAGKGRRFTAAGAALLGLAAWPAVAAAATTGPEPDPAPTALCGDEGDALGHCGESDAAGASDAGAGDAGASDAGAGSARDPGASDAGADDVDTDRGTTTGGRGAGWPDDLEPHNPGDDFDGIDAENRHDAMVAGGCAIAAGAPADARAPLVALLLLGAWLRRARRPADTMKG